jgi:uncharacterized protein
MPTRNSPGVYIEEISTLPPSVAEVASAIPAFIGYTKNGKDAVVEVVEISTPLEYEERFGKPPPAEFTASDLGVLAPLASNVPEQPLWYAISLYFKNGGGRCYVVSIGNYDSDLEKADFIAGLEALKAWDEPTLIVMPGAVALEPADFAEVNQQALAQCNALQDRFAIFDVRNGDVDAFRNGIGTDYLMYGAAYHPYLETSLNHYYTDESVTVGSGATGVTLDKIKNTKTAVYNQIKKQLAAQRVTLPPSAAIAGVYARVDRDRGVWKAPANSSLAAVIRPTTLITHEKQDLLNVDATAGKSINAIRAFAGKGTLVWGARTLAGNDNEWRYVNVRRLFIMIEESSKKATAFAVFEPNDATTWLKVKGMLEAYLYGLWEQGALQGAKPEAAFEVSVGLGKTMTPQDILEGKMIVEIRIAAVRPAEFITLRFSHKLAEPS